MKMKLMKLNSVIVFVTLILASTLFEENIGAHGHKLSEQSAHRVTAYSRNRQQQRQQSRLRSKARKFKFEESGWDTKADLGDTDNAVLGRESWGSDDPNKKPSGWVNPLSVTDDGSDDDSILDMGFKPLDEPYRKFIMPAYRYEDEIEESKESLSYAEVQVGKQLELKKKRVEQEEKEEAKKAAEAEANQKKQQSEKKEASPAKQNETASPAAPTKEKESDKKKEQKEQPQKEEKKPESKPAEKEKGKEKEEKKEAPAPTEQPKESTPAKEKAPEAKTPPAEKAKEDKTKKAPQSTAEQSVMQLHLRGETIEVTDLDDDTNSQQSLNQQEQEPAEDITDVQQVQQDEYSLRF